MVFYLKKKLEKENEILKIEIRDLKEQLKDEDAYHEEANKWCIEAQKLSIRINKAIEYINTTDKWLCRVNDNLCIETIGKEKLLEILVDEKVEVRDYFEFYEYIKNRKN